MTYSGQILGFGLHLLGRRQHIPALQLTGLLDVIMKISESKLSDHSRVLNPRVVRLTLFTCITFLLLFRQPLFLFNFY